MDIFRVSFIGHRVVDEYRQVEEELDEVIELLHRKYGFIDFNVGRNGEFDELATQAVRRFRREWEEWCELTLVEPYPVANLDIIEKSYDRDDLFNYCKLNYTEYMALFDIAAFDKFKVENRMSLIS